jgi:hypothetical protein
MHGVAGQPPDRFDPAGTGLEPDRPCRHPVYAALPGRLAPGRAMA